MEDEKPVGKRKPYRNTGRNVARIFKVLKEAHADGEDFLTISEIARRTGLHKWVVSRNIDIYMAPFVDITQPTELEAVGLQLKLIKLKKEDTSLEQVVNYLKLRRKMSL